MGSRRLLFLVALFCLLYSVVQAQSRPTDPGLKVLSQGKDFFQQGRYSDALASFREAGMTSNVIQAEAAFWQVKSLMALQRFDEAHVNLESFIQKYPKDPNRPEGLYLRARLLYLSADLPGAVSAFTSFLESYRTSSFAPNAYYWTGEGLLTLGKLDEAEKFFQIVLERYPSSFKAEAASYKLSLITLRHREEELLGLLKWSHEENIKNIEDFQRKEQAYIEGIKAYQNRLIRLAPDDFKAELLILQNRMLELQQQTQTANLRNEDLNSQLKDSQLANAILTERVALLEKEQARLTASSGTASDALEERSRLLDAKEEALRLKERALIDLEQNN